MRVSGVKPTDPVGSPGTATRRVRLVRSVLLLVLVLSLAYSLRSQWANVGKDVKGLPLEDAALALLLCLIAVACSLMAWRAMVETLGSRLPLVAAAHIYAVSQVGKYVPGSVW